VKTWLSRLRASLRRDAQRWRLAACAALLVACFFGPRWPMQRSLYDHVVVLDVTQSMNVQDQVWQGEPISRLRYAKQLLRAALLDLPCGSKLGWGLFTEYRSFLLFAPVEVCANLDELRATLQHIDGRMAWTGNSEVAKGVYSGMAIAKALPEAPALVFITDGQEAPPVNPRHRPAFGGKPGEVGGLLVGVGELTPSPIPKVDPSGRPLGYWKADEVMQTDPRSQGRGGSVAGEQMADDPATAGAQALPGAVVGSEHLSGLREAYLRMLAGETGLGFHRLHDRQAFSEALMAPAMARPLDAWLDLRPALLALALLLLLIDPLRDALQRLAQRMPRRDRRTPGATGAAVAGRPAPQAGPGPSPHPGRPGAQSSHSSSA
jgi:mxaL protein